MNLCFGKKNILEGEIILSHAVGNDKEVYLSDETLSGKVVLKDNEPISKKDLCLSFVGESRMHYSNGPCMTAASIPLNREIGFYRANIHLSSPRATSLPVVSDRI